MYRYISSAILLLGLCFISTGAIAQTQTINAKQQQSLKDSVDPYLTGGYSNDQQMALSNQCLLADPAGFSYQGGSKSVISLQNAEDFNQLQEDLNVDVSAKGGYGMFSGSTNASYARSVESDNYSEGFYYSEKITLPTKIFSPQQYGLAALSPYGQGVEAADPTGQKFRTACGDQYVSATPLGAQLMVTFKLNFSSLSDRESFDANIKGGMGSIFSASASMQQTINQYNLQGSLSVYALQEGGDATQLAKIFGPQTCDGHYCVSSCDLQHLDDCEGIIDGIISYAENDLPSQIDYQDGQIKGDAMPLSYVYSSFADDAGVTVGPTLVTPAVQQARDALGDAYQQQLEEYTFANHILTSPYVAPYINKDYQDQLQAMVTILHDNLDVLEDPVNGAAGCYQTPGQCISIYNQIMSELKPIDQQLYQAFTSAYLVDDQGVPYYVTPLGGNNYAAFHTDTMQRTAFQSVTPTSTGIHVDGTDIGNSHFSGDFSKQPDGNYQGTAHYDDGRVRSQTWTLIENPL